MELDGIHLESMEYLWNIPCEFHVEFPYGFHLFHVEYAWNKNTNLGGVSPNTYSIWNGWNPSGMTWIPHGIHVECGGRVKTSDILLLLLTLCFTCYRHCEQME